MTLPEQVGKVTSSAIDAMKNSPTCLAALIVISIVAVLSYFNQQRQAEQMRDRVVVLNRILDSCLPPGEKD